MMHCSTVPSTTLHQAKWPHVIAIRAQTHFCSQSTSFSNHSKTFRTPIRCRKWLRLRCSTVVHTREEIEVANRTLALSRRAVFASIAALISSYQIGSARADINDSKRSHLPIDQIRQIIQSDFQEVSAPSGSCKRVVPWTLCVCTCLKGGRVQSAQNVILIYAVRSMWAASQGQYYVTGKLTDAVYAEDCIFKDPTTNVITIH